MSLMTTHTLHVEGIMNAELHAILQSFWELESLRIQTPKGDPIADQFTSTIQMKGVSMRYMCMLTLEGVP